MIIGIDASRANRRHKTGTEWYSYYLIKALAEIDSENQYILYTDKPLIGGLVDFTQKGENFELMDEKPKFDKYGYQIIKSPHNNFKGKVLRWPFSYLWTLGRFSLQMIFKAPDVLFVPAHTIPLIHPKRTITTIHDIAFKREGSIYSKKMAWEEAGFFRRITNIIVKILSFNKYSLNNLDYLDWSTKFALQTAKKIITVSHFTKKEIIDVYKTKAEKMTVIHNGYNNKLYRLIDDKEEIHQVCKKYGLHEKYFLYVGRLEKKKNTPNLIEALAILKENNPEIKHKLVLIGDASHGYDDVKYYIEEFDLDLEVIMLGWVAEKDMPYIYNGASAFIFPTRHEGFGIPVIQALACGVPSAVSNIEVMKEVAGDSALFFDPYDKYAISQAMHTLVNDEELRNNLKIKGLERAKLFSWGKAAKETLKQIKEM
ncbi:MAG TPA: glycosyltransferase family 1 protein [Patescibacteria group bacterium]|nr:glycosyltransferase family 1 protein [Patescibacteria group bacterium]